MRKYYWCFTAAILCLLMISVICVICSCKAGAEYIDFQYERNAELLSHENLPTGEPDIYNVTGYDPFCDHCCGKHNGVTASGAIAEIGRTVAMKGVPFGTRVYIGGLGWYIVEDRGVTDGVIDVACASHEDCYAITGRYEVWLMR